MQGEKTIAKMQRGPARIYEMRSLGAFWEHARQKQLAERFGYAGLSRFAIHDSLGDAIEEGLWSSFSKLLRERGLD